MNESEAVQTIFGPLADWEVTLASGAVVKLAAHSYSEAEGSYVFSVLMKGRPPFLVDIATFPIEAVKKIRGG